MRWTIGARSTGAAPRREVRSVGRHWAGPLLAAALLAPLGCTQPPTSGVIAGLQRFASCDALGRYLQGAALERVGPYGLGGSYPYLRGGIALDLARPSAPGDAAGDSPPPPAPVPEHSGTNVQEAGVDEPDIVKNDGRRLLAVAEGQLHLVDLTATPPKVVGSLTLPGDGYGSQLLWQGDHVLAITSEWSDHVEGPPVIGPPVDPPAAVRPVAPGGIIYRPSVPRTRLTLIDIGAGAAPAVSHSLLVDGNFVDARFVGGRARVVTTSGLQPLPFVMPVDGSEPAQRAAQVANENVIRRTRAADWLPKVRTAGDPASERPLVACDDVARPPEFSGFETVSVLSLDLAGRTLDPAGTVGVAASGQTVYASSENLYVATQVTNDLTYTGRLEDRPRPGDPIEPAPAALPTYEPRTDLHAFDVSGDGPAAYRASGTVDGALLNQWSLSEHRGHLRVVTTTGNFGCGGCPGDQSQLSVLRLPAAPRGGELAVVGTATGMGKGEGVKAVRFLGDRAYVVTFRQVDPFYVVDLADPARPAVVGELKVPGYSAYLHPVGDNQVLGVGRDATDEGRVLGTKVSLYDVTDATNPTEVRNIILPDAWTSVEHTAKAFLWWEPQRLAVVPVSSYGAGGIDPATGEILPAGFTGVIGLDVNPGALAERGRVANEPGPYGPSEIVRSAVAGDRLLTVSPSGVRVSDLASLEPRSWVAFPGA